MRRRVGIEMQLASRANQRVLSGLSGFSRECARRNLRLNVGKSKVMR